MRVIDNEFNNIVTLEVMVKNEDVNSGNISQSVIIKW
jgi:hypothetical protein